MQVPSNLGVPLTRLGGHIRGEGDRLQQRETHWGPVVGLHHPDSAPRAELRPVPLDPAGANYAEPADSSALEDMPRNGQIFHGATGADSVTLC